MTSCLPRLTLILLPLADTRLSSHASPQKGTHTTPKSRIYSSVQRAQQSPNSPVSPLTSYLLKNSPVNLEAEPIRDKAALESLMQNIETNTRMWQSGKCLKIWAPLLIHTFLSSDGTEGLANTSGPSGSYLFTSTGGGVSAFSTSPSVLKFKAASKLSSTADRVVKERIEDGLVVKDPATVIFELKIDPYIDEWTENIRKVSGCVAQKSYPTQSQYSTSISVVINQGLGSSSFQD